MEKLDPNSVRFHSEARPSAPRAGELCGYLSVPPHPRLPPSQRSERTGTKCLHILCLMRVLYPQYIRNCHNSTVKKSSILKKRAKDLNTHFSEKAIQMADEQCH